MEINLKGQHAIVCGASQGIGASIATQYAQSGAKVTLIARNETKLNDLLASLEGQGHHRIVADLSDPSHLDQLEEYIKESKPSIIVNNAGGPPPGPLSEAKAADFDKYFQQHLFASHRLTNACLPFMKASRFGRVINIISTSVKIPIANLGVSNTIRGAMASWSKTMSNELAQYGITVNNILPGLTSTARLDNLIFHLAEKDRINIVDKSEQMSQEIPAKRFGKPEELAYLATFLASEMAAYITGTSIPVDGGKTGSL